ncbi:MAG: hypothetical protein IMZ53_01185 [Thermoplasmata archaeon]|nr:hypothetical protein [Thermoplasmata archaeon]
MQQVIVPAQIKDGVYSLIDREDFRLKIKSTFKDGLYENIVRPPIKDKSRPLEKYYWSVVLVYQCNYHKIFKAGGEPDTKWMHELNIYRYARRVITTVDGKEVEFCKRTSSSESEKLRMLGREQYEFVERVKAEEAIYGNYIPDPNKNIEPTTFDVLDEGLDLEKK